METHRLKRADTVAVKDDPVSGWAIAGIGLGVAFGGWFTISGAAKVMSKCSRSDYGLAG